MRRRKRIYAQSANVAKVESKTFKLACKVLPRPSVYVPAKTKRPYPGTNLPLRQRVLLKKAGINFIQSVENENIICIFAARKNVLRDVKFL